MTRVSPARPVRSRLWFNAYHSSSCSWHEIEIEDNDELTTRGGQLTAFKVLCRTLKTMMEYSGRRDFDCMLENQNQCLRRDSSKTGDHAESGFHPRPWSTKKAREEKRRGKEWESWDVFWGEQGCMYRIVVPGYGPRAESEALLSDLREPTWLECMGLVSRTRSRIRVVCYSIGAR
jgi:hypothetical protein